MGDGDTVDTYYKYFNPAELDDGSGQIDWGQVIENNRQWSVGSEFDTTYSSTMHRSKRIMSICQSPRLDRNIVYV